jgi:hypothetical protein
MDPDSVQHTFIGVGNDWKVYGLFPNSNTGLSALEARDRDAYKLTASMPNTNDMLEHMGCGEFGLAVCSGSVARCWPSR